MTTTFDREAQRLSKLPRAERFEELIEFPQHYMFKLIGGSSGFSDAVKQAIADLGYPKDRIILVERPSAKGRYVSVTFKLHVDSGEALDTIYSQLQQLPGLAYIF